MGKHEAIEPREPCLNTTYAYDTIIACGRPKGHGPKPRQAMNFSFGPENTCTESPLKGDEPVYGRREVMAFEVNRNIVRN